MVDHNLNYLLRVAQEAMGIMGGRDPLEGIRLFKKTDDGGVVTDFDRRIDELCIERFGKKFGRGGPKLITEESYRHGDEVLIGESGIFVIDPLDGTKAFAEFQDYGFGFQGAFIDPNGIVQVGIIAEPFVEGGESRSIYAKRGEGVKIIRGGDVSTELNISREGVNSSKIGFDFPVGYPRPEKLYGNLCDVLGLVRKNMMGTHSWSSRFSRLARGKTQIVVSNSEKIAWWDFAPGHIICEELGMRVSDNKGREIIYRGGRPFLEGGVFVYNPDLNPKIVDGINSYFSSNREN